MLATSIAQTLESVGFLHDFRESALVYPIVLSLHLSCIGIFGSMILMTDLRLLGLALKQYTVTEVVAGLRPWKHLGGGIMVLCGLMLGSSEAEKYAPNPIFWTKMSVLGLVLLHGIVFRPLVYKRAQTEAIDKSPTIPARAKAAACISLLLWTSIVCLGRWIAYWDPPKGQDEVHAMIVKQ